MGDPPLLLQAPCLRLFLVLGRYPRLLLLGPLLSEWCERMLLLLDTDVTHGKQPEEEEYDSQAEESCQPDHEGPSCAVYESGNQQEKQGHQDQQHDRGEHQHHCIHL